MNHFIAHAGKIPDLINPGFLTKWMDSNVQTFEFAISSEAERFNYSLEVEYDPEWGRGFARSESVRCNDTTLMDVTVIRFMKQEL